MKFNEVNFSNYTGIVYSISQEKIINKDITNINRILKKLRKDVENSCGKLAILFEGYDFDNREIYEINEIREYITKVFSENEDLFYYLTSFDRNCNVILACISDYKQIKRKDAIIVFVKNNPDIILKNRIIKGITACCGNNLKLIEEIINKLFIEY